MINNPLISIITISFNQDQFIEKTIESVLNNHIEILSILSLMQDQPIIVEKKF